MLDRARVREVYAQAAELPELQRAQYLERVCAGDAELRAEVATLLEAAARRPDYLSSPTKGGLELDAPEATGTQIGAYRLLEEIGRGGFGSVYMAEQKTPIRRVVAVKIIKLGMDTRSVIARFEAERQALAMMDHDHIARVLDAGATESGRPYFVMELVRGDPITAYADRAELTIAERLSVFVQVCQAVQHAHQKGVIHRDIKPANILVATQDGRPHAKVIDFGIAKATSSPLTDKTLVTEFRQLVGTPEYMSPEQVGGATDIDTRTDVYSLGVLLYELLTGVTPFDAKELRSASFADVQRLIRDVEPAKPSTRLSRLQGLASVAALRKSEPERLGLEVSGDLDWIVMKSLEKDRARRYETPSALAADIERHLAGEAVSAAPPSRSYRTRKFLRRHRVGVATGSVVVVALVSGAVAAAWGMVHARERERAAQAERDLANGVRAFLSETFGSVSPQVARGRNTELLGALMDKAAARIEAGELRANPGAEHELRHVIARVYLDIARYDDARRMLPPIALDAPVRSVEDARNRVLRASLALAASDVDGAERFLLAARKGLEDLHSRDAAAESEVFAGLASVAVKRRVMDVAEQFQLRALQGARSLAPPDVEAVADRLWYLGTMLNVAGREDEALSRWDEALRLLDRPEFADSPTRAELLIARAIVHAQRQDPARAKEELEEAIGIAKRVLPPTHPVLLQTRNAVASIQLHTGSGSAALAEFEALLAERREQFGPDSIEVARTLDSVAHVHFMVGRYQEALDAASQGEAILSKHLAPQHVAASGNWTTIVDSLRMLGRNDEALRLARQRVEVQRTVIPPESEEALVGLQSLMASLFVGGEFEECVRTGREILALRERARPRPELNWIHDVNVMIAGALLAMPPSDNLQTALDAEPLARAGLEEREQRFGPRDTRVANARVTLGYAIAAQLTRQVRDGTFPGAPARDSLLPRFREAEALIKENIQSQIDLLASMPASIRRIRAEYPLTALVELYRAWDLLEPGAKKAEADACVQRRDAVRAMIGSL